MLNVLSSFGTSSRFTPLTGVLIFLLWSDLGGAVPNDHPIIFKAGQTSAYAEGQFSREVREVYFSFQARVGQHLFVKITPLTPQLITAGVVIYPSGKRDGGPGGIIFDSELTETGKYRLRVTQRQVEIVGKFRVLVQISPQENKGTTNKYMRQSKAMVNSESGGQRFCEAQAIGVSWGRRWMGVSARPGRTAAKYSRTGMFIRRQVSTTERMVAILGPACWLPMWIRFLRPSATGRMEFSARLLLSSGSGYSRSA
jgi:hypothetical protein